MSTFTPTPALLALLQHFEGLHDGDLKTIGLQPKLCPANIWTEGWGHAMRDEKGAFLKSDIPMFAVLQHSMVQTRAQADTLLIADLQVYAQRVRRMINRVLPTHEFEALVSFEFNTGSLRLPNNRPSQLLLAVNQHDTDKAASEFTRWVHAGGKRLIGLVWRRNAEVNMYLGNNWRHALGPDRQHLPSK